jgi:hypothetical protein
VWVSPTFKPVSYAWAEYIAVQLSRCYETSINSYCFTFRRLSQFIRLFVSLPLCVQSALGSMAVFFCPSLPPIITWPSAHHVARHGPLLVASLIALSNYLLNEVTRQLSERTDRLLLGYAVWPSGTVQPVLPPSQKRSWQRIIYCSHSSNSECSD